MGEVERANSFVRDGARQVGGHEEVSGGGEDGEGAADAVHDGDKVGEAEITGSQHEVEYKPGLLGQTCYGKYYI